MTHDEVMTWLEERGSAQQKKTFIRHGCPEPFFGTKIGDMKVLEKKIKGDHDLALSLYKTGNSDAMYFAGLIAEPKKMTKAQLNDWAKSATWHMISDYTVAWTAAESNFATELAKAWINAKAEKLQCSGWNTYSSFVAITDDADLDLDEIDGLLEKVVKDIGNAPNRVKYCMNGFVISVGTYVEPLLKRAKAVAKTLGKVDVDMGDTSCKVPLASEYIAKVESMGRVGKKRKMAKC